MTTMDEATQARWHAVHPLAQQIMLRLAQEVGKLGFDSDVKLQAFEKAQFSLSKDPADGRFSLVGQWHDARGNLRGNLIFHADSSFFVEQDIALPHPQQKRWFVEAVNAWGKGNAINAEARLLPMPE